MSHCLILQQYNDFYIGADSAGSMKINGSFYRTSNNMQKIFRYGEDVYFCSGISKNVDIFNKYITSLNTQRIDVVYLRNFLINTFTHLGGYKITNDEFDVEVLLCRIEDGVSKVYHFAQYNNFDMTVYEGRRDQINIICGGYKTTEGFNITKNIISCGNVQQIYNSVFTQLSDECIGGELSIYHNNTLFYKSQIDEYEPTTHLLLADAVVSGYVKGSVIEGGSLKIGGTGGTFIVHEDGSVQILAADAKTPVYATQNDMDVINNARKYHVELLYDNSTIFGQPGQSCTLTCEVYKWDDKITELPSGTTFKWLRNGTLYKTTSVPKLTITNSDIDRNAIFSCSITFDETKLK